MLLITSTYRGTGILLQGDYYDLDWLYATVHAAAVSLETTAWPQYATLMNLANELYYARQGEREKEQMANAGCYFGLRYLLPQLLVATNVLRVATSRHPTFSTADLAQVALLEACIREALVRFDANSGEKLGALVGSGLPIDSPFLTHLCHAVTTDFVNKPTTKARFQKLGSSMLDFLHPDGEAYSQIVFQLHEASERLNCPVSDLRQEWPVNIVW